MGIIINPAIKYVVFRASSMPKIEFRGKYKNSHKARKGSTDLVFLACVASLAWVNVMSFKNAKTVFDAPHPAAVWAETVSLDPLQVDCVTAVMLTILDNQCKMGLEEQIALMAVYSVVRCRGGLIFDQAVHQTIERAQALNDHQMTDKIHELHLFAENAIPRQVMRYFMRFLRESLYGV
ncbi:MAG: hypothetical protein KZQ97_02850 [Candidatus Thiodiazotropha sp. (ex Dulcina madagascariensis)]|nr:hypothetical protein [Candidatus Thiodiazotropha sp. (ex Dulcina madagascariensis)]